MPLLAYFGLIGSILIGLLYVAEAQLGPPPQTVGLSTNFHGLPAPYKQASTTRILTARDAPAPVIAEEEHKVAQPAVTPPIMAQAAPTKIVVRAKAKKVAKSPRPATGKNLFADSNPNFGKNHRVW